MGDELASQWELTFGTLKGPRNLAFDLRMKAGENQVEESEGFLSVTDSLLVKCVCANVCVTYVCEHGSVGEWW